MKKCPFCEEQIQDDAVKCRYCKEWLTQTVEGTQEQADIPAQDEQVVPPKITDDQSVHNEKKPTDSSSQKHDNNQPQAVESTSAIKERETWFFKYYKPLLVSAIILPMLAAIVIPVYLVMKERTQNAQSEQSPAPPPVQVSEKTTPVGDNRIDHGAVQPVPASITEEPTLPPGHKALILMADSPLDRNPIKAVNIFFKYKPQGSDKYASKILMQNVPVISYSAAERQIEIHIPAEDVEKLKNARTKGKLQVLTIK